MLRTIAGLASALLMLFGGLFMLQGMNLVRWPADSFMLGRQAWVLRGAILLLFGVALFGWSRLWHRR